MKWFKPKQVRTENTLEIILFKLGISWVRIKSDCGHTDAFLSSGTTQVIQFCGVQQPVSGASPPFLPSPSKYIGMDYVMVSSSSSYKESVGPFFQWIVLSALEQSKVGGWAWLVIREALRDAWESALQRNT